MNIQLYLDPKDKVYYFVNNHNILCTNCIGELESVVFIKVVWDKLGSGVRYYCSKCTSHYKSDIKATFVERFGAIITDEIHRGCEIVLFSKPSLTDSVNVMVFDIDKLQEGKTVDRTVFANRESWEGSSVGSLEYQDEGELTGLAFIEEQKYINPISDKELDKLLLEHKNSIPIIEYEKQKLLEGK